MINGAFGASPATSLMNEYSALLGAAALRQRARTAEQTARIEAELAGKVKSEFISNMSHELRTPLNTVIGFSKLLSEHDRRHLPAQEIVEYANLINDAAAHLLSVINDILDISKMQSGRYSLDDREVDLEEILNSAVAAYRNAAKDAGVSVTTTIGIELPAVLGDSEKLYQVVSNILSNAIKFTPSGGAVRIELLRAHNGVTLLVRDTGVGMTPEEIAVALTPFGQVEGGRNRWREGTGLGLPIAKALVGLHSGIINIRSAKGEGTEVSVFLPSIDKVTKSRAVSVAEHDALTG